MALIYPDINPVAFALGPLRVRWYGLLYTLGIALAWLAGDRLVRAQPLKINPKHLNDLLPYVVFGMILGARMGHVFFYDFNHFSQYPLEAFYVWRPGLSFHGGLLGVIVAGAVFIRKHGLPLLELADIVGAIAPVGLFCGRLGNFMNGELWGRTTDVPWGVIFQHVDQQVRHPSQLYEAALEGVLLFALTYGLARLTTLRIRYPGMIFSIFLMGYSVARMTAECFREPDADIGYLVFGTTWGQWLSFPMIVGGLVLAIWSKRTHTKRL